MAKNKFRELQQLDADASSAVVSDLTPGATYTFRVRSAGPTGKFSPYAAVTITLPH